MGEFYGGGRKTDKTGHGPLFWWAFKISSEIGGKFFDISGTTKTGIFGQLRLFHDRIEFEKHAFRTSKRWKIVTPFESILVDNVTFVEKDSGDATVIGGGITTPVPFSPISIGVGTGVISKIGNLNLLVIPYIDENGIKHAPR